VDGFGSIRPPLSLGMVEDCEEREALAEKKNTLMKNIYRY